MVYVSIEDFYEKAGSFSRMSSQEEMVVDYFDFLQDSEPFSHR